MAHSQAHVQVQVQVHSPPIISKHIPTSQFLSRARSPICLNRKNVSLPRHVTLCASSMNRFWLRMFQVFVCVAGAVVVYCLVQTQILSGLRPSPVGLEATTVSWSRDAYVTFLDHDDGVMRGDSGDSNMGSDGEEKVHVAGSHFQQVRQLLFQLQYDPTTMDTVGRDLIVFVADDVPPYQVDQLEAEGAKVQMMKLQTPHTPGTTVAEGYVEVGKNVLSKLRLFNMTAFDRVLYVDPSQLIIKSLSPVWTEVHTTSLNSPGSVAMGAKSCEGGRTKGAPPTEGKLEGIPESSLVMITPDQSVYNALLELAQKQMSRKEATSFEQLIHQYFNGAGAPPQTLENTYTIPLSATDQQSRQRWLMAQARLDGFWLGRWPPIPISIEEPGPLPSAAPEAETSTESQTNGGKDTIWYKIPPDDGYGYNNEYGYGPYSGPGRLPDPNAKARSKSIYEGKYQYRYHAHNVYTPSEK